MSRAVNERVKPSDESLKKFAGFMKCLLAVPKRELDKQVEKHKRKGIKRRTKRSDDND